ncbi:hypothetical protein [Phaeacidiphilus oryzae]|uniref:hypothetical protein n=1 Tax=Phaeacidiphilus oryzae TaxID=348818 RepID=UPI0005635FEC|nr:hypothetical protein [Phaeacidiphilus oryzae]
MAAGPLAGHPAPARLVRPALRRRPGAASGAVPSDAPPGGRGAAARRGLPIASAVAVVASSSTPTTRTLIAGTLSVPVKASAATVTRTTARVPMQI